MGRPRKENKLSVAERCKKYRETHKTEYRASDNLRKKLTRLRSRADPEMEKKRLKKQAEANRLQRLKKKVAETGMFFVALYYYFIVINVKGAFLVSHVIFLFLVFLLSFGS